MRVRIHLWALALPAGIAHLALAPAPSARAQGIFIRGDCTQDLTLDIADPIKLLGFLFLGDSTPSCLDACDFDDSEENDISDSIALLGYLFLGGPAPPPPHGAEGIDPEGTALTCANGKLSLSGLRVGPPRVVFHRLGETAPLLVLGVADSGTPGSPVLIDLRLDARTSYRSDHPEVAEVSASGVLTARGPGAAAITARHLGFEGTARVRVVESAAGAPALKLLAPPEAAVLAAPAVLVLGVVSDPGAAVEVAGAPVPVEPGTGAFRARVDLVLGLNAIEVSAASARGSARARVNVLRALPGSPEAVGPDGEPLPQAPAPYTTPSDREPPRLAVAAPRPGETLNTAAVEVRGTVDDPLAVVRVNGVRAESAEGAFSARLVLGRGPARIDVEAVDPVGNRDREEIDVTVDFELPAASITEPPLTDLEGHGTFPEGVALVSSTPVEVRGTLSRPGMQVSIQGAPALVEGTAFRGTAALDRGLNRVVVLGEIPGGPPRRVLAVRRVILDADPPEIEIHHPPEGHRAAASPLRLAGRIRNPGAPPGASGAVELRVNDSLIATSGGAFEASVPLVPGANTIRLRAIDRAGNEARRDLAVVLDPSGPTLEAADGDGQAVAPGAPLPRPIVVRARAPGGGLQSGVPVVFRVVSGDGSFTGGTREHSAATDAAGEARVGFTAGLAAGRGLHVVAASSPGRAGSPAIIAATVFPGPLAGIAAHSPRWQVGAAGAPLQRPVSARAFDAFGNPLPGFPIEFKVISGPARLGAALEAKPITGPAGIAAVSLTLGGEAAGDARSVVAATALGGHRVTFIADSLVPGAPADTVVEGRVEDLGGAGIPGLAVRVVDVPGLETLTDPTGRFELSGVPVGPVALAAGGQGPGGAYAAARREALLVAGRRNVLPEPIRLVLLDGGPREASVPVSELSGATAAVPAIPGMRLEVPPGSARFPGGSRRGRVTLVAASLEAFPGGVPDGSAIEFQALILPEEVRFDPPARLLLPAGRPGAGRDVALLASTADAGGFFESGLGRVGPDHAFVESLPGLGIVAGGAALYALPGPAGGRSAAVAGKVALPGPGASSVDQRPESPVLGMNVYAHSGEFFLEGVALEIPGRGLHYRFRYRYESRHSQKGALGYNWEHEYSDRRLERVSGSGNLLRADGRGRSDEYLHAAASAAYVSPLGVFARLFALADGRLVEREPDGTRYVYHAFDGTGRAGRLSEITDRAGNSLRIERDDRGRVTSVRDTMGRSIDYEHDEEDRIVRVGDFTGRVLDFAYDSRGDLVAVTGPSIVGTPSGNDFASGRTTRYEYLGGTGDGRLDHNLVRVFAPNEAESGPPRVVNLYDEDPESPTFDRVVAQDWGGINGSGAVAGGRLTLEYRLAKGFEGEIPAADLPAWLLGEGGVTVLTDRRGLRTEVEWNRLGLATAIRRFTRGDLRPRDPGSLHPGLGIDPPFFETRHTYSAEGLLLETVLPRGDRWVREYDLDSPIRSARARVVRETHHPAPGDPSARAAAWSWVYDPLFGERVREVSARGNDPSYVPPNGGTWSPERYTTLRFLDYQEGNGLERLAAEAGVEPEVLAEALERSGMQLGLGDLNGDGDVSGGAGWVVKTAHPPVLLPDGEVQEAVETAVYNHLGQLVSATGAEGAVTRFRYHPETDPDGDGQATPAPGLNPNTGGFLSERIVDADPVGPFPPARVRTSFTYDARGYPSRITDGRGNATELVHNAVGELVQVRAPAPLNYRELHRYDANGNRVGIEVENLTSNLDGFPLPVRENRFYETEFVHDILDRLVEERREVSAEGAGPARVAVTRFRYDPSGNLEGVVHPEGDEERLVHDERELLLERARGLGSGLDPGGEAVERFDYDEDGNLVRAQGPADVDGDGARETTERRYDGLGRLAAEIDPAGGTRFLAHDAEGRLVSEATVGSPGGSAAGGGNVLLDRVVRAHDERGREYRRERARFGPGTPPGAEPAVEVRFHDRQGSLVRRVDAAGGTWTEERDGAGRPARSTDPLGNSVSRSWDAAGNLIAETRTELSSEVLDAGAAAAGDPDYDPSGRLRDVQTTAYAYDALNRLSLSIDGAGRTRRFRYDSRGNLVHATDAVGTVIHAGTDPELAPLLSFLTPRQADHANGHGNQTHFEYDGLGRRVRAVHELRREGEGQRDLDHGNPFNDDGLIDERFEWDLNGRLAAWIDDRGGRTTVAYDRLGRPRVRTEPDGKTERYDWDLAGNLTRLTDRIGTVFRQSFDRLGRPVRREVDPGAGEAGIAPEGTRLQAFEYDGLGRATLLFDGNRPEEPADDALVLRGYDSLGEIAFECQGPFVFTFERDGAGRPEAVVTPSGPRLATPHDALGRTLEISDGFFSFARYGYLGPGGRVLRRIFGSGVVQEHLARTPGDAPRLSGYGPGGEVEAEEYLLPSGGRVIGFEYGHDRAGRWTYERALHRSGRGPAVRYDSVGRLREVHPDLFDPRVPPSNPTDFARYFADGNHNPRLAIVDFVEERIEVDVLDRITKVGDRPLSYDGAGNLAAAGGLEFRHDAFGRLVRIVRGGSTAARFAYDATGASDPVEFRGRGRAVRREVLRAIEGDPAGVVRSLFLGERPYEERAEAGGPLRQYLFGSDGRGVAALDLAGGGRLFFLLSDGLGNVAAIADGRGTLLEEVSYDPFGMPTFRRPGSIPTEVSHYGNRILHAARRFDPQARLYESGARHRSPALDRHLSRGGPLLLVEPLKLNRYKLGTAPSCYNSPKSLQVQWSLPNCNN